MTALDYRNDEPVPLDREQPAAIDAERAVLGSILILNKSLDRVAGIISAESFRHEAHQKIYRTMNRLALGGIEIDLISLKDALTDEGILDQVGGSAYVSSLVDGIPDVANVERYARIVAEKAQLRAALCLANDVIRAVLDGSDSAAVLSIAENRLVEIAERSGSSADGHRLEFVHAWRADEPGPQRWIWDGWFPEGFVSSLYAMGGSSKSFLALYLALQIARGRDVFGRSVAAGPVLYLDGELDADSWLRRAHMLGRAMQLDKLPPGLVYARVHGSILQPANRRAAVKFIETEWPALTILDSFTALLPGADTNSLDDVAERMKALEDFGSALLIDHAPKNNHAHRNAGGDATPIGSVTKWNLARSAIHLSSSKEGGVVLRHMKNNFGPLQQPIAYTINIGGGQAHIEQIEYTDARLEGVESALPVRVRVEAAFTSGELVEATSREVAEHIGCPLQTVKNTLTKLKGKGILANDGKLWCLRDRKISPEVRADA